MSWFRARFLVLSTFAVAAFTPLVAVHAQSSAAPAIAKQESNSESTVFVLRWMKPSQFAEMLMSSSLVAPGIVRVSPDDTKRRIFIQGTPEALAKMQEVVRLLDCEPRRARLSVRVLRAPANQMVIFGDPGQKLTKGTVVSTATAEFKNNESITLHAVGDGQGFHIPLTPHINGDYSVSIAVDLSDLPASAFPSSAPLANKETKNETSTEKRIRVRRIANGAALLVASGVNCKNKDMAYYLEVTPIIAERQ